MAEKTNRRELIVEATARLFIEHGYDATSIRHIAEEVGCTEAALYYHFKDGKRELLQAVLERNMPDLMSVLDQCDKVDSLYDLVRQFGHLMLRLGPGLLQRLRWFHAEYPRLSASERALFHEKYLSFQNAMRAQVQCFVADPAQANLVAWLLLCTLFGYGQLFLNLEVESVADISGEELLEGLALALAGQGLRTGP